LEVVLDSGKGTLITLGFAKVEMIRKNKSKKNMMSLSAPVATSVWNRLFLLMAMA
jgi:hypothetical protein